MPPRQTSDEATTQAIAQQPQPKPAPMISKPGVVRDGTLFSKLTYTEAVWTRFYQSAPWSMGGYRELVRGVDGVARCMSLFSNDGYTYVHLGSTTAFQRFAIDLQTGVPTTVTDRSPAGYSASDLNLWCADTIYMQSGGSTTIFAAPVPQLVDITSEDDAQVYYGDVLTNAALTAAVDVSSAANITTSGGLVAVGPYLLLYGHDGLIQWCVPGVPLNFTDAGSGDARPVADKIIKALPLRGQAAPAAIFWSLSSVIVGNFVGGTTFWSFNTVSTNSSILSTNCVVEHNGIYYWATTSGFLMFSGVVQDIKNDYNQQFFLQNLDARNRQKVFAVKNPRWREIWWCFPKGDATEPNHAVVFNYGDNVWYDTPLPNGGRSAGYYEVTYSYPMMAGVDENDDTGGTSVWQHEFGKDEISGPQSTAKAVLKSYRTHEFNTLQTGDPRAQSFSVLEPDFGQTGLLTMEVFSRNNARAPEQSPDVEAGVYPYEIVADPDETQEMVEFKWTGRLTSFKITSNEAGGSFSGGLPVLHWKPADGRRLG